MGVVASIDRFVDSNIICFLEKRLNETNPMDAILVLELQGPLRDSPERKLFENYLGLYMYSTLIRIKSEGGWIS